jgi:molybdate transport system ATP-binding protein
MTAALEVAVARQIGEFELDVAFTVESGISVLFGPSGAGKSLTLALIAGLIRPDTGTIVINGRCRDRLCPPYLRLHPRASHRNGLSGWPAAAAPLRSRQRRPRRPSGQRPPGTTCVARSWLERVGAEEFADRRPGSLSGGQRQRVALARGLAGDPALVLLDEPLSALDSAVRRELRELIREVIISSGVPAVLVTHDAEEAEELGDVSLPTTTGG